MSGSRRRPRWAGARGARCSSRSAGPPATGKSTLAGGAGASRARWSACPPTSSARRALVWRPTQRAPDSAYARDATLRTYQALGQHAAAALAAGCGAVIDATMGDAGCPRRVPRRPGARRRPAWCTRSAACRAPRSSLARARAKQASCETSCASQTPQPPSPSGSARGSPRSTRFPRRATAFCAPTDRVEAIVDDLTTWVDRPRG